MRRRNDKKPVDSGASTRRTSRRSIKSPYHLNANKNTNVGDDAFPKSGSEIHKSSAKNYEVDSSSSNSSQISDSTPINTVPTNVLQNYKTLTMPVISEMGNGGTFKVNEDETGANLGMDSSTKFLTGKIEEVPNKTEDSSRKTPVENTSKDRDLIFGDNGSDCIKTGLPSNCGPDDSDFLLKAAISDIPIKSSLINTDNDFRIETKCLTGPISVNCEEMLVQNDRKTKKSIKTTRKRKWLSKRSMESKGQILSISTDSLKKLIADVLPVPLSDVKLESSSEVEEVYSDKSEFKATSPKHKVVKTNTHDKNDESDFQSATRRDKSEISKPFLEDILLTNVFPPVHKPPSPPKNESSTILFITNLVRPFTLLQLKGLLARTGKIVPGGFWIDRIKSKCYVQYETEDDAIETRHALHGVHWPPSNPKCLNVDFGNKICMEKAVAMSGDETLQFGKDSSRENRIVGTGWDRNTENFEEKKITRTVREWDVGKREDINRSRETEGDVRDRNYKSNQDERKRSRQSAETDHPSTFSMSPNSSNLKKKENDPPLRLLDDLFRKTRVAPCIYWLPLTPEQIAGKEAFRLKRLTEHQERKKKRELDREKELTREKEREKGKERQKDREKEHGKEKSRRRDRSNNRSRSGSRQNRRY